MGGPGFAQRPVWAQGSTGTPLWYCIHTVSVSLFPPLFIYFFFDVQQSCVSAWSLYKCVLCVSLNDWQCQYWDVAVCCDCVCLKERDCIFLSWERITSYFFFFICFFNILETAAPHVLIFKTGNFWLNLRFFSMLRQPGWKMASAPLANHYKRRCCDWVATGCPAPFGLEVVLLLLTSLEHLVCSRVGASGCGWGGESNRGRERGAMKKRYQKWQTNKTWGDVPLQQLWLLLWLWQVSIKNYCRGPVVIFFPAQLSICAFFFFEK